MKKRFAQRDPGAGFLLLDAGIILIKGGCGFENFSAFYGCLLAAEYGVQPDARLDACQYERLAVHRVYSGSGPDCRGDGAKDGLELTRFFPCLGE